MHAESRGPYFPGLVELSVINIFNIYWVPNVFSTVLDVIPKDLTLEISPG